MSATKDLPENLKHSKKSGQLANTIAYFAATMVIGLSAASLGPTLPGLAANTRTNLGEISFLFTARSLGTLLGSVLGGRLYDRSPGNPVLAGVLLVMAIMLGLIPTVPLLWMLTLILLILGFAEGMADVGGNAMLIWVHGKRVGPFLNGLHFFFGVGAFFSPIIVAQALLLSGDIRWAYWLLSLLILPVIFWMMRQPSPTPQTAKKDGEGKEVNPPLVFLVSLFLFLYVGAEVSYGGWIFTYATRLELSAAAAAAYLTSAFWGGLTLGRLASIPIAVRYRPRTILLVDLFGCLLSLGVILTWRDSLAAVWVGTIGIGLSMASIFPTALSLAERRMILTGRVTGWFFVGSSAGAMLLPWLVGQLFEPVGPQILVYLLIFDLLAALLVFSVLILYSSRPIIK
jgi:FHS family Na+ dependent glucose MFS transporter 1